jgi:hypothetical protein
MLREYWLNKKVHFYECEEENRLLFSYSTVEGEILVDDVPPPRIWCKIKRETIQQRFNIYPSSINDYQHISGKLFNRAQAMAMLEFTTEDSPWAETYYCIKCQTKSHLRFAYSEYADYNCSTCDRRLQVIARGINHAFVNDGLLIQEVPLKANRKCIFCAHEIKEGMRAISSEGKFFHPECIRKVVRVMDWEKEKKKSEMVFRELDI